MPPPPPGPGVRLLDASTSDAARRARAAVLRAAGFEVLEAATADEAVRVVRETRPALVLIEAAPQGFDVPALCRRLRGEHAPPPEVLLLCPASCGAGTRVQALEAGVDAWLPTPADDAELLALVRALLRRQAADEEGRSQTELLAAVLDHIPVLLAIWNPTLQAFRFNRHFREVLGWTEADAADGGFMERAYPDPEYRREVADYMRSLAPGWRDLRTTAKQGAEIDISWANVQLSRGASIGIGVEVTERKRAEEQLRATLESIGDGFFACDAEWRFVYVNAAAERILGISRDDVLGKSHWDVFPLTLGTHLEEEYRRAAAGEVRDFENLYEPWGRWFHNRCYPRTGGGMSVYFRDITARKHAEAERERMLAENQRLFREAQEANRLKDEFLATLSHELRTPLNAILGWAMLLRTRAGEDGVPARALDAIERNAQAQAQLISDILDVSNITAGRLSFHVQEVAVAELLDQVVEGMRPAAERKALTIAVEAPARPTLVRADPDRLRQVVSNLLSNALKFTPEQGTVSLALQVSDGALMLVVRDDGIGIEPGFLPHVFERFRQGDASTTRSHTGLGLGLAIAKYLVEMQGGTITAESGGLGHGATFTVRLPTGSG
jgi:PAS domain S-box-containing protein